MIDFQKDKLEEVNRVSTEKAKKIIEMKIFGIRFIYPFLKSRLLDRKRCYQILNCSVLNTNKKIYCGGVLYARIF